MNRTEHLLCQLAEECAEVAQRVSKAMRFGLSEVEPDQDLSNAARILVEYADLIALIEMLNSQGALPFMPLKGLVSVKKMKVEKYLRYAEECGTLKEETE